jgi:D-alanyl-D-alanine carboxypeptidase
MPSRRALGLAALAAAATVGATAAPALALHSENPMSATASSTTVSATTAPRLLAPRTIQSAPDASLASAVRSRMAGATARSWSVVVDIAGKGRVVDINGSRGYQPASTQKLFTTVPILLRQPTSRLVTSVGSAVAPVRGVLHGDLVVTASGDPNLRVSNLLRLARVVHTAGVRRVTGHLILDVGSLSLNRGRSGWKSSYVPGEVGPLSPFAVNRDQISNASGYLRNPTAANLLVMRHQLNAAGVTILGSDDVRRHVATAHVFASHASVTLASIIRDTLVFSENFYAEQLLTIQGGRGSVSATASAAGVSSPSYATDGSGLSYSDVQSARGEATLLSYAASTSAGPLLHSSLPVACRTGTLEHLLCGTRTAGKVFAKTGTLDHAKALSGYTTDAKGRTVTFAILTNGDRSTSTAMRAIEKVVYLLRGYDH